MGGPLPLALPLCVEGLPLRLPLLWLVLPMRPSLRWLWAVRLLQAALRLLLAFSPCGVSVWMWVRLLSL